MPDGLFIATLAGLGGMFGWGLADFFAKKTIDEIGDIVSLVWAHVFGTLALFFVLVYQFVINGQRLIIPSDVNIWGGLIFFGVLQALVYLLVYIGFGKGQLAVLNPVFASFSGLTALLSVLIFKEAVGSSLVPVLILIFSGVFLLSTDFKALRSKHFDILGVPGSKEVLSATLFAAFWTLFWDKFVGGQDWISYAFYMYLFMTITLIIYARFRKINLHFNKSHIWKFLVLIGVTEVLAYLAISWGYSSTAHTSIVALLSGAFSLPTIILAFIFLKERISRMQIIGCVMVLAGIISLSLL